MTQQPPEQRSMTDGSVAAVGATSEALDLLREQRADIAVITYFGEPFVLLVGLTPRGSEEITSRTGLLGEAIALRAASGEHAEVMGDEIARNCLASAGRLTFLGPMDARVQ